ncbi:hypothetical protein MWU78_07025 [Arenibacter sp. F26102]|nr:hypothetical protein [Arenibacter sp. F26102]MCK0145387.1 hypothetical protein [Arenibacter sp. F26102]
MKTMEISHAEKIMFPETGITKGDQVHYYLEITDYILPYIIVPINVGIIT